MTIYKRIRELLDYAEQNGLIEKEDRIYSRNLLLDALKREREILKKRLSGKQKAGLDGGDDTALLNQILEYMGE